MRINGFHQITAFYSIVFNQEFDFKPQHISLYIFLLNQNNRNNWVEWFKCPIDLGMTGSCIGSKKTYYQCLEDLKSWGLLNYEKGENMWKAPKISLVVLKSTSTYTSTVPQSEPLPIPQPIPLEDHNLHPYINLQPTTKNNKQETIEDRKLKFAETLKPFENIYDKKLLKDFFEYWTEPTKSGNQFRMELQKTWGLERRLKTWANNDKSFSKTEFSENQQPTKISFK
jgi:hypothetical protein